VTPSALFEALRLPFNSLSPSSRVITSTQMWNFPAAIAPEWRQRTHQFYGHLFARKAEGFRTARQPCDGITGQN
jgi:hypothetical protein